MIARRWQGRSLCNSLGRAASTMLSVFALTACGAGPAPGLEAPKPNVLILFSDDQRADTIAALGNPHIRTPNLDRLVRRGTAFTRAYCMGSHARGGLRAVARHAPDRPHALPRQGRPRGPAHLARGVRQAGYATFLDRQVAQPGRIGPARLPDGQGDLLRRHGQSLRPAPPGHLATSTRSSNERESGEHSVELFADAAVGVPPGPVGTSAVPLLCGFQRARTTRAWPRRPTTTATTPTSRHCPANFLPQHPFDNGALVIRDEQLAPWPRTPEVVRQHLADYYAAIEFLDAQVGRILDALAGERPGRQHDHRLHQRPRPGDRQPRAVRQAEPLRPLDARRR